MRMSPPPYRNKNKRAYRFWSCNWLANTPEGSKVIRLLLNWLNVTKRRVVNDVARCTWWFRSMLQTPMQLFESRHSSVGKCHHNPHTDFGAATESKTHRGEGAWFDCWRAHYYTKEDEEFVKSMYTHKKKSKNLSVYPFPFVTIENIAIIIHI